MATQIWRGDAEPVPQVVTLTPAAPEVGDVFTVTIGDKTVSYTSTLGTVAEVCSGLQQALAAANIAEFQEATWTTNNATVTGTATNPGIPFTASLSVTRSSAISAPSGLTAIPALADGSLASGTTYYYVLTALTALGETSSSAEVSAAATSTGAISLSWTASTGATAYRVYRGTASGAETYLVQIPPGTAYIDFGPPVQTSVTPPATNTAAIAVPTLTSATSNTSAGSVAAGTYYYKITGITALGETTVSNEHSATLASTGQIVLVWPADSGATGFKVYRGTSSNGENKLVTTTGVVTTYTDQTASPPAGTPPTSNSAYIAVVASPAAAANGSGDGSLTSGTVYFYEVTATNAAGETTVSNEAICYATATQAIQLAWGAVTGAAGYNVYRYTSSGNEVFIQSVGNVLSFTDWGTIASTGASPPGSNGTASAATFTLATVTASSGPNDISTAANWSVGSLPANGDDIWFINSASSALYGLTALAAVTPNSVNVDSTYSGTIGLPKVNATGGYREYRQDFMQLATVATTVKVGTNPNNGPGSGRIKFDFQSYAAAIVGYSTGQAIEQGVPAMLIKGTNLTSLEMLLGTYGVAFFPGESATLPTINVGYTQSQQSDVSLVLGAGCTLTTVDMDGGQVLLQSNATTVQQDAGSLTVLAGAFTILVVVGGTCYYQSTGTVGTAKIGGSGGTVDCSRDMRARQFSQIYGYAGGTLNDPFRTINYNSQPIDLVECGLATPTNPNGFTLNAGQNIGVLVSSLGA